MSKPRLAGFPAALFLAGLGLSLYYADAWWRLPEYSEKDIAASVELNLAMDLQSRNLTRSSLGSPELQNLRSQLQVELQAEILQEQRTVQRGFAAGVAALLLSLIQMLWLRRLALSGETQ
ncbi:MAG: hypothetical protein Q8Q73_11790 [Stagnimonas sp.]|nr:hypothetical protein [Stagnimonas sp.]